ncbi:MAG: hypothetical protein JNM09_28845 [Blastocatellia bacterium]|nr:hypothetical protein [Blastocatellia bacterium]
MNSSDPISLQIDVIARLLETAGYAIDVDYTCATIIVWCENWPVLIEIKRQKAAHESKRQKAKGKGQKERSATKPPSGTDDG